MKFYISDKTWNNLPNEIKDIGFIDCMFNWLKGYLEAADYENLSEGASDAVAQEGVEAFTEWYNQNYDTKFTLAEYDWCDIQIAYIEWETNL